MESTDKKLLTRTEIDKFMDNLIFAGHLKLLSLKQIHEYREKIDVIYKEFWFEQIFSLEERIEYDVLNKKINALKIGYCALMEKHLTPGGENRWGNYIELQSTAKKLSSLKRKRAGLYTRAVMRHIDGLNNSY